LRSTFITNLSRADVSPKMAQSLARHSDINLTMNTYTKLGVLDQAAAVESLPPLPDSKPKGGSERLQATGTDGGETGRKGPESGPEKVPTMVPSNSKSAQIGAVRLASETYQIASSTRGETRTLTGLTPTGF